MTSSSHNNAKLNLQNPASEYSEHSARLFHPESREILQKLANKTKCCDNKNKKENMCSTRIIRNKLCKKVYTVLFILLYGLFSTTHAAISNRSNKSLGERWILLPISPRRFSSILRLLLTWEAKKKLFN